MDKAVPNTLPKKERIFLKADINRLMSKGKYGNEGCIRYCWLAGNGLPYNRIMVSVPKRNFKRAVKRNLLKRRIRESYRLRKALLLGAPSDAAIAALAPTIAPAAASAQTASPFPAAAANVASAPAATGIDILFIYTAREILPSAEIAARIEAALRTIAAATAPTGSDLPASTVPAGSSLPSDTAVPTNTAIPSGASDSTYAADAKTTLQR